MAMTLSRPFAAGSASPYPPSHSTHEAFSHTGLSNARGLTSSQLFYGKKSSKEKRTWVTAVDKPQQDMCVCLNIRNTSDRVRRVWGMPTSLHQRQARQEIFPLLVGSQEELVPILAGPHLQPVWPLPSYPPLLGLSLHL